MAFEWSIRHWPPCDHFVFLSHCQEDRRLLVRPIFDELRKRHLLPWLDEHHYPRGRPAMEALRDGLMRCRHVVYFVTPAALRQGRGWMAAERAITELIQQQFKQLSGSELMHVELPLLFIPSNEAIFQRSSWRALVDNARIAPDTAPARLLSRWGITHDDGRREWTGADVQWAVDEIEAFVAQEQKWATENQVALWQDPTLRDRLLNDDNFIRRITGRSPLPPSQPM